MRRQANGGSDVRLEINNADSQEELLNDIVGSQNNILGSQSDIDDSQNSEIDLLDEEDTEEFLSQQPLVRGVYPGQPPPPCDSQGETYHRLTADDEADTSPMDVIAEPLNSYRYPKARRSRHLGTPYPREIKKTLASALFMCFNFLATTISLSITHERVPQTDPLPDIILDFFRYQYWALTASEVLLSIQSVTAVLICIFHKHRFIVLRRLCLLLGLLYGYRAITMFVTVLPISNPNYQCDPKLTESGQYLTVLIVLRRAVKILSGFGLSMNGQHVFCGDFIFSGHTMIFLLCYLVIIEYTSKKLYILHWLAWINAIIGVTLLLMARGHYSIDVILAYWITTRLWYLYHSMTSNPSLKQASNTNYFSKIWWWTLLRWFEENVKTGQLPNGFNLPLPKALCKSLRSRSRTLVTETSRLTRNRQRKYKEEA